MTQLLRQGARVFCALVVLLPTLAVANANLRTGLVESETGNNLALLVGAPNGLSGVDHDLSNMQSMVTNAAYQFNVTSLYDAQATKQALLQNLTDTASRVGANGTLLFYFSGHGNEGIIAATNLEIVSIEEIRDAILQGRNSAGPVPRLVMIFDSCNSGSLLGPMGRRGLTSQGFADAVVRAFQTGRRDNSWSKLFVFASSRAEESSLGADDGGLFTTAMTKAFGEVMSTDATVGDFISKTEQYTDETTGDQQHPVARLVPDSLRDEKMKD